MIMYLMFNTDFNITIRLNNVLRAFNQLTLWQSELTNINF